MKGTDEVLAIDPETGKAARMTRKAFDGVYFEKGFTLVDRDNADDVATGTAGRKPKGTKADDAAGSEPVANKGAAAIAETIGLNEKSTDTKNTVSEGRKSAGRDRGGR